MTEEFPGCGKLKRPVSPALCKEQRSFILNYSYEAEPLEFSNVHRSKTDNDSLFFSLLNELPYPISVCIELNFKCGNNY